MVLCSIGRTGSHKSNTPSNGRIVFDNLPEVFVETISYGMIGYVIPHDLTRIIHAFSINGEKFFEFFGLICELSGKMNPDEWIKIYEANIKR